MSRIENTLLSGAQVLRDGALTQSDLYIDAGQIWDDRAGPMRTVADVHGYLILPGIIDLHGDAFERHLAPRPSAPFPSDIALASVDRDAASNGVTTAWMAQSWSWEGGSRGPAFAEQFMIDLANYRPHASTDLRIQLRCETHTVDTQDRLLAAMRTHDIDYVVFNDHLGEALAMVETDPEELAAWGKRAGRTLEAHIALVRATRDLAPKVPRYLCNLAAAFDEMGVRYGSHDDPTAGIRDYYSMMGAKICEFPTDYAPAKVAKASGDPILMGAPNVVRGGSQSGNIAATDLIRTGLCDVLVSDYHYPSLANAAFILADSGEMPLAAAWAMISTNPAQIMGLRDRGEIAAAKRADLVICNAETRQIEGTISGGVWSHLCGGLAQRIYQGQQTLVSHAAE